MPRHWQYLQWLQLVYSLQPRKRVEITDDNKVYSFLGVAHITPPACRVKCRHMETVMSSSPFGRYLATNAITCIACGPNAIRASILLDNWSGVEVVIFLNRTTSPPLADGFAYSTYYFYFH